jgi:hypothetical protein
VDGEEFGADVLLTLTFAVDDVQPFTDALRELSAGRLALTEI